MTARRPIAVGDRIKLTADFLRSTGQLVGGDGSSRWTVVDCGCGLCQTGRFIAVDQPAMDGEGARHINRGNVQRVRDRVADRVPQAGFTRIYP